MKPIFATVIFLIASIHPGLAEEPLPTIREHGNWIIISGTGFEDRGPLPWTHSIRKDTILSINIRPDPNMLFPENYQGQERKKFHDTPKEEIPKLGAVIDISTSELTGSGDNRQYTIPGLTNTTAPAILGKLLEAVDKTAAAK